MKILPEQRELCRELPVVIGNVDYQEFRDRLERMDELLRLSGVEREFVAQGVKAHEAEAQAAAKQEGRRYPGLSLRRQVRIQRMYRQALRCNLPQAAVRRKKKAA